ncbi:MAG: thioredoxin domain-containing protein [Gemmatimonadota bacterium]|nr:thioredoxin domain-containing protein [Gemmatimonadota bacterium]MDE2871249.1 thioredoxin domain-containing protein [Gemmatimonadota bacterium]
MNPHYPPPGPATPAALLLMAVLGCGGSNDGGDASPSGGTPPASGLTTDMLAEEGAVYQPPAQEIPLEELGFDFGSDDAPIGVIEFSDYGCGYCRRFHAETFPTLLKDYIETGKVRWKYVTYVSGSFANGLAAAFVAECAGEQGLFTPVSDVLFERQPDWNRLADPFSVFTGIVRDAGVDVDELQACINEQRPAARVRSGVISGRRLGLRGTPAFLVDGKPVMGAQPLEWWVELFTAIEEEAGGGGERSGPRPPP